jgi:hypothetical protein
MNENAVAYLDGLDLTPVPSPTGDGCLLVKVNAFPLAAKRLGDDVRELQVKSGEE